MEDIVKASKLVGEKTVKDLTGLVVGDNLDFNGRIKIVQTLIEHKALYLIHTMYVLNDNQKSSETRTIRQRYAASRRMLESGQLLFCGHTILHSTEPDKIFYYRYLTLQHLEVTA